MLNKADKATIFKNGKEDYIFIPLPEGADLNPLLENHEDLNLVFEDGNWEAVLKPVPGTDPLICNQWIEKVPGDAIGVTLKPAPREA